MTLLIVYEDEVSGNPIVYAGIVGNTTMDCRNENDIEEEVRKAVKKVGIKNASVDDIVYDLMRIDEYTWVDEYYCFAIKNI